MVLKTKVNCVFLGIRFRKFKKKRILFLNHKFEYVKRF